MFYTCCWDCWCFGCYCTDSAGRPRNGLLLSLALLPHLRRCARCIRSSFEQEKHARVSAGHSRHSSLDRRRHHISIHLQSAVFFSSQVLESGALLWLHSAIFLSNTPSGRAGAESAFTAALVWGFRPPVPPHHSVDTMKLFTPQDDVRGSKVLVTAAFLDLSLQTPPFIVGEDDKEASFLSKSPLGRLPVLESELGGGVTLFESNAICRFLARLRADKCLYGETLGQQGEVDMWLDFCTLELEVPMSCLAQEGKVAERARIDIEKALSVLNTHLKSRTFMVGEHITIADICLATVVYHGLRCGKAGETVVLEKHKCVKRWFDTICNQKAFKKGCGGGDGEKKEKAAAQSTHRQHTQKPAAASAGGARCAGADVDDEEKPKSGGKPPNELDLLPPSSMHLDEWKRTYSNTKDLYGVAMKWFWEHLDQSGYSLWYMKYQKLEGECRVAFLTSNQLGGFLQRVDPAFRKYSFGVIDVLGTEGRFDIEGVWLFRGQDMPLMMKNHPSYEYNTWVKLDPSKPQDRKMVEDFWCACDDINGRPIADSKVWK